MNLEARLLRLESKYRRLRRAFGVTLVLAVSLVLLGKAPPRDRVVVAREFVVEDASGAQRIRLGLSHEDRGAGIALQDGNGKLRALVTAGADGTTSLILANGEGQAQLSARVKGSGSAGVELADDQGNRRVKLAVGTDGEATVALIHRRHQQARLTSLADGSTRLSLSDQNREERAWITVDSAGQPQIATIDSPQQPIERAETEHDR